MQILRPNSTFRVLWVTADPSDATTYFPQVTIKQTLNGTVLLSATNLALDANGRYYYDWIVPGDTSGQGLQIDVTVTVYTDAGHTLYSSYERENRVYNIFDLASLMRGGGSSIDYGDIQDIVKKELGRIEIPNYKENFVRFGNHIEDISKTLMFLSGNDQQSNILEKFESLPNYGSSFENLVKLLSGVSKDLEGHKELTLTGIQNLAESFENINTRMSKMSAEIKSFQESEPLEVESGLKQRIENMERSFTSMSNTLKSMVKILSSIQTVTVHSGIPMPEKEVEEIMQPTKDYSQIARKLIG